MKLRSLFLICWLFCSAVVVFAQKGKLTKVPINTLSANPKGYIEYLPPNYSSTQKYPVLFWLPGLGEVGPGTSGSLETLMNRQIANWLKSNDVDFIVLVPQDASGYWNGTNGIAKFVEWAKTYYKNTIDLNQQHMAGLSSGGYGIRDFIVGNTTTYQAFSTFTPMSTNLDGAIGKAPQIVSNNQYVWIHQGTADVTPNQINAVQNFHNALYKLDSKRARLTAYVNLGHSAWDKVYNGTGKTFAQWTGTISGTTYYNWTNSDANKDWFGWMKSHPKNGTAPPPASDVAPTSITLSATGVASGAPAGTVVGNTAANGTAPVTITLVSGASDNAKFRVTNNQLVLASALTEKSSYTVQLQAANGQGTYKQSFTITVATAAGGVYSVYPNPMTGNVLSITPNEDNVFFNAILVLDASGIVKTRFVNVQGVKGQALTFPFDLPTGIYTLQIWRRYASMETVRLVKN